MALTIKCAREYYLNGVRLQCTATFAPNSTSIKILGHKVSLIIILEPNQETVNGIIFLLENLKFCKGMHLENVNVAIQSAVNQKLSFIYNEQQVDERICSKACEKINSWNFKHDFCGICDRLVRSTVKRKMEQELPLTNEQISTPNKLAKILVTMNLKMTKT